MVETPDPDPVEAVEADTTEVDAADALIVDGVDIGATVRTAFEGLTATLGSITDAASAEIALPELTGFLPPA